MLSVTTSFSAFALQRYMWFPACRFHLHWVSEFSLPEVVGRKELYSHICTQDHKSSKPKACLRFLCLFSLMLGNQPAYKGFPTPWKIGSFNFREEGAQPEVLKKNDNIPVWSGDSWPILITLQASLLVQYATQSFCFSSLIVIRAKQPSYKKFCHLEMEAKILREWRVRGGFF